MDNLMMQYLRRTLVLSYQQAAINFMFAGWIKLYSLAYNKISCHKTRTMQWMTQAAMPYVL
jgi:hypothetical protein